MSDKNVNTKYPPGPPPVLRKNNGKNTEVLPQKSDLYAHHTRLKETGVNESFYKIHFCTKRKVET